MRNAVFTVRGALCALALSLVLSGAGFSGKAKASRLFEVFWDAPDYEAFSVYFDPARDDTLVDYLKKGLEVTYKFSLRLCRHRSWLDRCQKKLYEVHKIRWDPLIEKYAVTVSRQGEVDQEQEKKFNELKSALLYLGMVKKFPLKPLRADRPVERLVNRKKYYLSVRLESNCKGDSRNLLEVLAYILTFGQVDFAGFDTGAADFDFNSIKYRNSSRDGSK